MTPARITERRLELLTAVLLAIGTLATAWAAYQARQWTGEQSQGYSAGTAARIAENRAAAKAGLQQQVDIATAAASERAKDANQRADDYMLAVVLFASALFFAGISTKLEVRSVRATMLGLAGLVLIGAIVWIATFPIRLDT
jgi:2-oxoglutarate dehydrogenase complex dehydrogenase (E1) component-like enzyme